MRGLRALAVRLAGLLRGGEDDAAAELESHVAMHTEAGMRAGLSEPEARRRAVLALGGSDGGVAR